MNRRKLICTSLGLLCLLFSRCEYPKHQNDSIGIGEIRLGNQIWMDRHLSVQTFRNGDPIPEASTSVEWQQAGKEKKPAWCYYKNDPVIGEKYGVMYNWYAVMDPRGLAPVGWHVPTNEEWIILENYFGVSQAGTKIKCDSTENENGNTGTNREFCALLGGYRTIEGNFTGLDEFIYLTSASEEKLPESKDKFFIWGRGIHVQNAGAMRCGLEKEFGLYVRCVRNEN
jgi:uncharacterized protein (TIGR02145 family)